ncbi:DUF397 domain-containing protein [Nocardiopsis sp. NPDC058631]|uniref:DUF397 domain-containing protein n=1 Tax=Nocardiopsis sp. NPDC058631 TaxID=3346566 RepID=UPI0036640BBD
MKVGRDPVFPYEWRKSSYSAGQSACVEVAMPTHTSAAMRDTKHRDLGALTFPGPEWQAFLNTTQSDPT